jgi:predicted metal-dependent peptidase
LETNREDAAHAEEAARRVISLVCVSMPHLSGLAYHVRIHGDDRVGTAGVFASGRLLVNPKWFLELTDAGRAFVLAHELLHLALLTHVRVGDADPRRFNLAHDLIINDMLENELGMRPPGDGVRQRGARYRSVEELMLQQPPVPQRPPDTALAAAMREALARQGQEPDPDPKPDDVLDDRLESEWFPDETPQARTAAVEATQREATKAVALQEVQASAREFLDAVVEQRSDQWWGSSDYYAARSAYVDALEITYRPPWELALHRWLDTVTEPQRTYRRASRRGGDRTDVVLPGRVRDAQTLSIVLDTSGSMTNEIAHALGSIMAFGRGANIETVRIVQCDTAVTRDDVVAIDDLATHSVSGYGGSDMTPAMSHLAHDFDTTAVVVITDGAIVYPAEPTPYHVLWVVYGNSGVTTRFNPRYGQVVHTHVGMV